MKHVSYYFNITNYTLFMYKLLSSTPFLITAFILSLPILLFIYQPSMQLGGFGLLLGMIGMTISPIIIFGILLTLIFKSLQK